MRKSICVVFIGLVFNGFTQNHNYHPLISTDSVVVFDHQAGFYDNAFQLKINAPLGTDSLVYTLDGSNPYTSKRRFIATGTASVSINPDDTTGRGKTPAVVVKAALLRNGQVAPHPFSQTYLFPDKVLTQAYPGGKWPQGPVNGQVIDYEMDPNVVNDAAYSGEMKDALLSFPSLSISTDLDNLFNRTTGIYVNADNRGESWERECSAELLNPDGNPGFSINAGLRLRGGASRSTDNPKHSFRLFFSEQYGASKLEFPLFGEEGASKFDKIDLRTEQNYSWNGDGEQNAHNTFVREIFSRDMQKLMQQPYSRGRYYHLYLNGMYWGIYQTDERTDASYANQYLGGKKTDYDVIKVSPENFPYTNEVADGNDKAWNEIYKMCTAGFKTNADYFKLEGRDENGNHVNGARVYVNIDNLIDYMLLIFYTGNFDAPVSAFWGNKMPNNYYAIYNRNNKADGFIFLAHDSEHTLMVDPVFVGNGLYEDRVNIATITGWYQFRITRFLDFNPQWLHYKLTNVAEYRQRFADRAAKYFGNNGLFTPDRAIEVINKRIEEMDTAIVAESARWGDARNATARTRNDDWYPEIESLLNDYFPYRTEIVKDQLLEAGLFSPLKAPVFEIANQEIQSDQWNFESPFSLKIRKNGSSTGSIIYTLDGTDPRTIGGEIGKQAITADGNEVSINITHTVIVKARLKKQDDWGSMQTLACLYPDNNLSKLMLTEINYHPMEVVIEGDTLSDKKLEFIEFKNTDSIALNLSGLKMDSAVNYTFPANTILGPGQFYVVASDSTDFAKVYGIYPSGEYKGNLANSGEYLRVNDAHGNILTSLTYSDKSPWPQEADGQGYSLTSTLPNPTGDPDMPEYWKNSKMTGGSPFADDTVYHTGSGVQLTIAEGGINVYPNPASDLIQLVWETKNRSDGAQISIYDWAGREVFTDLVPENNYSVSLQSLNLASGVYMVHIRSASSIQTAKVIFVKP